MGLPLVQTIKPLPRLHLKCTWSKIATIPQFLLLMLLFVFLFFLDYINFVSLHEYVTSLHRGTEQELDCYFLLFLFICAVSLNRQLTQKWRAQQFCLYRNHNHHTINTYSTLEWKLWVWVNRVRALELPSLFVTPTAVSLELKICSSFFLPCTSSSAHMA